MPNTLSRHQRRCAVLLRHSHLLHAAMNIAYDRHQRLNDALETLGFAEMPTDTASLNRVQAYEAKRIGGVYTMMLLDAPNEMMTYHYGPLQMSLALFDAIIYRYKEWAKALEGHYRDSSFDAYLYRNQEFVDLLGKARISIVHVEDTDAQRQFTETFNGTDNEHLVILLIEGARIFDAYVARLLQQEE